MTPALRNQVLREWRPYANPELVRPPRPAAAVNQVVPKLMKQLGLEQRLQQSQVFFLWAQIVGSDIARHAQPVGLRNGSLIIAVDHPIWLQELKRYHKPMLLQKIRATVGDRAVKDLVFRIG